MSDKAEGEQTSMSDNKTPGFLETLILIAHSGKLNFTVSVMVDGVWFSGEVTTEAKFLDYAAASFGEGAARHTKKTPQEMTTGLRNGAFSHLFAAADAGLASDPIRAPDFLYLADVRSFSGKQTLRYPNNSVLRFSLHAISVVVGGRLENDA